VSGTIPSLPNWNDAAAVGQQALSDIAWLNPRNGTAHFRLGQAELRLGDPAAAENELKQARDLGLDARGVNTLLAQAYMAQGKYNELLREFSPQGLPPEQAAPLLILRSAAQLATGNTAAAQASAAEAERLTPQSLEAQLNSARVALAVNDLSGAETKIGRVLAINPRSGEALLLKGQLQNQREDRVGAIRTFGEAIAAAPNLLAARLERAGALVASNEDAKAREDVEAVLKVAPNSALAVYLKGVILARAKDYAAADAELGKLTSSSPDFPRRYYFHALVKHNLGQEEQAADAAARYLRQNPNDPDAIRLAASIEMASRRQANAIRILSKATDLGVADTGILELLGQAYALNGQPVQAVRTLERADALAPDNAAILTGLAAARMATGDAPGAISDLQHALKIPPTRTDAAEVLVTAALASGDIDKALPALAQVKNQEGDSEAAGNLTAMIKLAQVDLAGAAAVLSDTLKRFPQSIQTRINLARVLVIQNKPKDAEQLLNEVLEREPANAAALNALIPILQAEGQTQRAMARAEAAHGTEPLNPAVTAMLVNLLVSTGEAKKALELVEANLKDSNSSTQLLVMKARLQVLVGQPDAARDGFRRILDLEPANLEARGNLVDLLVSANDTNGAKAVIANGLRALPGNDGLLHSYIQITLRAQGLDAALEAANRLAADAANQPAARLLKGDAYALGGRFADAIAAYQAEQRAQPSSALALRIAAARSAAGQADQAALGLREWLATERDDADAAMALSQLDLQAHLSNEAEAYLQVVLNKRPNDAPALNNLAWIYQQRNDARARGTAERAYMIWPVPQIADTLGWILTTGGDAANGAVLLRQAAAQLGSSPSVQYHLAVALKGAGQPQEALAVLRPIVEGPAGFAEKRDAARLLDEISKEVPAPTNSAADSGQSRPVPPAGTGQ
jgi:putative PEP-CTERM system TPR-repeat lipoprotein